MTRLKLYGTPLSGHVHRVTLLLRMLELEYEFIEAGAELRATEAFRKLNPWGQIPVLVDGETVIADSNAILIYLTKTYAPGTHWLPEDAVAAAHTQQWLCKAAGEIRYGPASARLIAQFGTPEDYPVAVKVAKKFMPQLELHLSQREFLVTDQPTVADLACYSYVALAPEGGISLEAFPAIRQWLLRIESLPGFIATPPLPLPKPAQ
ncbi:glutathione S-transferase family protein [Rouxiella sp. WC2420]|uniref:Glutathione S-transferase family protein n=1 Tax=Rouxiella sp. WC2420 TaxID=3234145 RepID=A0AB39VNS6_9GAMM